MTTIKEMNNELRMNAPIPKGEKVDYTDDYFENIYNGVQIRIARRKVTDSGIVLWFSEESDCYTSMDLEQHWKQITWENHQRIRDSWQHLTTESQDKRFNSANIKARKGDEE